MSFPSRNAGTISIHRPLFISPLPSDHQHIRQRIQAIGIKRAAELVKATGAAKGNAKQWLSDTSAPTGANLIKLAKAPQVKPV